MKAPERLETPRLLLRRPTAADAGAIFGRYSSDPEATRFLSWPTHRSLEATRGFLAWSDEEWRRWPAGPYLVESRDAGLLLGSSGLAFQGPQEAALGYVFARDAWGHGYATEAVLALVALAPRLGVRRLEALCHHLHRPSGHVLEKAGFVLETILPRYFRFPNDDATEPVDVRRYRLALT